MQTINVLASYAFAAAAVEPPLDIKTLLREAGGPKLRRTNRITELSLLGALHCVAGRELANRCGLYLASGQGSVGDTSSLMQQILRDGLEPMPLSFINVSSNMPGYYVAQTLGLESRNLAVSSRLAAFDSAFELARLDLAAGNVEQALVGVVEECSYPLDDYRRHVGLGEEFALAESSAWLLLGRGGEGGYNTLQRCQHFATVDGLVETLQQLPAQTRYVVAGEHDVLLMAELARCGFSPLATEYPGHSKSIAAWRFVQAVGAREASSLLYLGGNAEEGFLLLWLLAQE